MNNYLVLVRGSTPGFDKLSDSEKQTHYGKWMTFMQQLMDNGSWVKGHPLDDNGRLYCDKRKAVEGIVGGPEESIGGYLILQAENYDEAVQLCDSCPTLDIGGGVEIRECIDM